MSATIIGAALTAVNRTLMELKYPLQAEGTETRDLLIVP